MHGCIHILFARFEKTKWATGLSTDSPISALSTTSSTWLRYTAMALLRYLRVCFHTYMTISQEEVYITDWWLSPEVYLKRGHEVEPGSQGDYRLDKLLKKKAVRMS